MTSSDCMHLALPSQLARYRRIIVAATHAALVALAYALAYAIRFDFDVPRGEAQVYWATLPYVLIVRVALLEWFRLHQGYWRHFSLRDLLQLAIAVSLG